MDGERTPSSDPDVTRPPQITVAVTPRGRPVTSMSVRELIGALAKIEDALRAGSGSGQGAPRGLLPEPVDPVTLQAQGLEIVDELHRRSTPAHPGMQGTVHTFVDRVLSADPAALLNPGATDPDTARVTHRAQGEELGQGVVRVLRVAQNGVEGGPGLRADPDGVEPTPH